MTGVQREISSRNRSRIVALAIAGIIGVVIFIGVQNQIATRRRTESFQTYVRADDSLKAAETSAKREIELLNRSLMDVRATNATLTDEISAMTATIARLKHEKKRTHERIHNFSDDNLRDECDRLFANDENSNDQ